MDSFETGEFGLETVESFEAVTACDYAVLLWVWKCFAKASHRPDVAPSIRILEISAGIFGCMK